VSQTDPNPQPDTVHLTGPPTIAFGSVPPSRAGAKWWMYQRPELPTTAGPADAADATGGPEPASNGSPSGGREAPDPWATVDTRSVEDPHVMGIAATVLPSGVMPAVIGFFLLFVVIAAARTGSNSAGLVFVPLGALLLAAAYGRRAARVHPHEPWLGRWIVLGVVTKLLASYFRYFTLVNTYGGVGDASTYDRFGRLFAAAWRGQGEEPPLPDLHKTNFLKWFTGVVYFVFGSNMIVGFFIFGLLALVGSCLWYRATADAVPFIDKRLYLFLVLFAPSIMFWPSSIGKESLMQLGIGTMALGTSMLLRHRLLPGLAVVAPGGWLLWIVRPHLLVLVAMAGGVAYLAGRVRQRGGGLGSLMSRPAGILIVAFLVIFTLSQGAKWLGLEDLSLSSIQSELDATTEMTAEGGSHFDNGGNSLSPLHLPEGAVTVLLRPFPWETDSGIQLLASLESALLAGLMVIRISSLRLSLSRSRTTPFLMYAWILTILYSLTFASFANFGILVRQRSLVLPALYVLIAVDPRQVKRMAERDRLIRALPPAVPGAPR
jgi:hypothetical protein